MKKIALGGLIGRGRFALIDDEDFDKLIRSKWHIHMGYAVKTTSRKLGKQMQESMHRVVMNCPSGMDIDHRDMNPLNNQKSNLRICTRSQNMMNKRVRPESNIGYKGVSRNWNKYHARIQKDGKRIDLGSSFDPKECAKLYDAKAKELFGSFARLNFPEAR